MSSPLRIGSKDALAVACPFCLAPAGDACRTIGSGLRVDNVHPARVTALGQQEAQDA